MVSNPLNFTSEALAAQATLAPNVVSGLEAVARDFLGKTLELGCAAARRRRSDVLAPSDLAVGLERMWCVATICATGCCRLNFGSCMFHCAGACGSGRQ